MVEGAKEKTCKKREGDDNGEWREKRNLLLLPLHALMHACMRWKWIGSRGKLLPLMRACKLMQEEVEEGVHWMRRKGEIRKENARRRRGRRKKRRRKVISSSSPLHVHVHV